jgi:hypothetical protein
VGSVIGAVLDGGDTGFDGGVSALSWPTEPAGSTGGSDAVAGGTVALGIFELAIGFSGTLAVILWSVPRV